MREVLPELLQWWEAGATVGVGTVVGDLAVRATSAGRRRCSSGPGGEAVGSVSGGCVEGAVYELAQASSPTGRRSCSATASATTTRSPSG